MTDQARSAAGGSQAVTEIEEAGEKVARAVARYFGSALAEIDGMLADSLRVTRYKRAVRLVDQVELFLIDRELRGNTRPVPAKLLLPIFSDASLEEDDNLQDRWAALLANALDPSFTAELRSAYTTILRDLSVLDARNLEKIYSTDVVPDIEEPVYTTMLPERLASKQEAPIRPAPEVETSLANLARLGLITTGAAWGGFSLYHCAYRTSLGKDFYQSVSRPRRAV